MDNDTILTTEHIIVVDPIPTDVLQRFHKAMTAFWFLIALCGISLNAINIHTFIRMGLEDSVTTSFFALSVSDFCICCIAFFEMIPFTLFVVEEDNVSTYYIPPAIPSHYIMCIRRIFNVTTILITTFLAMQRCLCVVIPFHVRGIFTRSRTVGFLTVIFTASITCHALYIWRHRLVEGINPLTNSTQLRVYIPPGSEPYLFLMEAFLGIAMNMSCQIIVLVCLLSIRLALRKSVHFRESATAQGVTPNITEDKKSTDFRAVRGKEKKVRTKEWQALVQVSLVSILFIVTNSPYLGFGITNLFLPGFGFGLAYHNLCHLFHNVMFTSELCNSSVNFIVYFKYNSKFRSSLPFNKK